MKKIDLVGKRTVILGMGISGRSAAEFLLAHQAIPHGIDRDPILLSTHPEIHSLQKIGLTTQLENQPIDLATFDLLVLSPGISRSHPLVQSAKRLGLPMVGEIELGVQYASNPMIGITGTNGKTTVTLLITHVLNHLGIRAHALGNVGVPLTRAVLSLPPSDRMILELSSDQIETLYSRKLESAVILNITPDHLDRYETMEMYAEVKCNLERCIRSQGTFYMEEKTWEKYAHFCSEKRPLLYGYSPSSFIYTDLEYVFRDGRKAFALPIGMKNKKSHDVENLLAAFAICADNNISGEAFLDAWSVFKKPSHRIEFVAEHLGIRYFDDSKGTNIDAVVRAVQYLEAPIILIAGGVDKHLIYTPWLEEFRGKVKCICAIGQAAPKMQLQLSPHLPVEIFASLEEAVHQATRWADPGDIVLLSPGSSSYDMFKDYAHRGREFQRIVHELSHCEKALPSIDSL